jgi:NAD(P) transhydrogenase
MFGTGPGGEGAAMQATKLGRKVAVVERYLEVGGSCTHLGTIPTKALRFAIAQMTELNRNRMYRQLAGGRSMSFSDLRRGAESIVRQQVDMRSGFYERNRVTMIGGQARFLDPHTMEVETPEGAKQRLSADAFIVACGVAALPPARCRFLAPSHLRQRHDHDLEQSPQSITVYGAGVIGCEWASMFRNLGWKVNLVNTRTKLLEFLDDEIIDALSYHLRDCGVLIRHQETYARVEGRDDGVVLHLQSGKQLKTDILLWANGRTGNSDTLGRRTSGNRARQPRQSDRQRELSDLRAARLRRGRCHRLPRVGQRRLHAGPGCCDPPGPRTVRPDGPRHPDRHLHQPEISSVGKTERELTAENVPYEVGHAQFKSLAPGTDFGPDGRHAQAAVPPRNAGHPGNPLLRRQRFGDHPHRPGDHVAARRS